MSKKKRINGIVMTIGFFLLISKSVFGPLKAKQPGLTHREVAMVDHLIKKTSVKF